MVKDTKLYDILSVQPTCSKTELTKAYRKLAIIHHPDKNPNDENAAQKFGEIKEAYEILSDDSKRHRYDLYGMEGFNETQPTIKRRTESVRHTLYVTLEDLYNGKEVKLSVSRKRRCDFCNGCGTASGKQLPTCNKCNGQGVLRMQDAYQREIILTCGACVGMGFIRSTSDLCRKCSGTKLYRKKDEITVYVEKGLSHGSEIKLHNEADEHPDPSVEPGDIIIIIKQNEHDVFKRQDEDLFTTLTIPLSSALNGFKMNIKHLDGRILQINTLNNYGTDIIEPDGRRMIQGEGMPKVGQPTEKGNLYITFKVDFTALNSLSEGQVKELISLLPPQRIDDDIEDDKVDHVNLSKVKQSETKVRQEQQGRVQCAQQ